MAQTPVNINPSKAPAPQNGQAHSSNLSDHFVVLALKGLNVCTETIRNSNVIYQVVFTIFFGLNAHLQKSVKPQTHHNKYLINCSTLINQKGIVFMTQYSKHAKPFLKIYHSGIVLVSLLLTLNIFHTFSVSIVNFRFSVSIANFEQVNVGQGESKATFSSDIVIFRLR